MDNQSADPKCIHGRGVVERCLACEQTTGDGHGGFVRGVTSSKDGVALHRLQRVFAGEVTGGLTWKRPHTAELFQIVERLERENQALRNLANNLRPGPISEALCGSMDEDYRRAGLPPNDDLLANVMETLEGAKDSNTVAGMRSHVIAALMTIHEHRCQVKAILTQEDAQGNCIGVVVETTAPCPVCKRWSDIPYEPGAPRHFAGCSGETKPQPPVVTPDAWLVIEPDGWRYLSGGEGDARAHIEQRGNGGTLHPLYRAAPETNAPRALCPACKGHQSTHNDTRACKTCKGTGYAASEGEHR